MQPEVEFCDSQTSREVSFTACFISFNLIGVLGPCWSCGCAMHMLCGVWPACSPSPVIRACAFDSVTYSQVTVPNGRISVPLTKHQCNFMMNIIDGLSNKIPTPFPTLRNWVRPLGTRHLLCALGEVHSLSVFFPFPSS